MDCGHCLHRTGEIAQNRWDLVCCHCGDHFHGEVAAECGEFLPRIEPKHVELGKDGFHSIEKDGPLPPDEVSDDSTPT